MCSLAKYRSPTLMARGSIPYVTKLGAGRARDGDRVREQRPPDATARVARRHVHRDDLGRVAALAPRVADQADTAHERAIDECAEHLRLAAGREARLRGRERLGGVLLEARREGLRVLGEAAQAKLPVRRRVGRVEPPDRDLR